MGLFINQGKQDASQDTKFDILVAENFLDSRFFLDYSSYTETEKTKGMVERIIVETIMCTNYLDSWKKQTKEICKFLNKKATNAEFERFADNLHRLEGIVTDEIKDIFNSKDSFIFLTLFDRFTGLGVNDVMFAEFLAEFKNNLRDVKTNDNGLLFDEIDKDKGTKDKAVIIGKLQMLESLMLNFLHIENKNKNQTVTTYDLELFISENVKVDKETLQKDMDLYFDTLEGDYGLKEKCIKVGSSLLDESNRPSLLAMVAYSYKTGKDLDDWLTEYAKNHKTYFADQKKNYLHMLNDFRKFDKMS